MENRKGSSLLKTDYSEGAIITLQSTNVSEWATDEGSVCTLRWALNKFSYLNKRIEAMEKKNDCCTKLVSSRWSFVKTVKSLEYWVTEKLNNCISSWQSSERFC